jgi:hypothetical protein
VASPASVVPSKLRPPEDAKLASWLSVADDLIINLEHVKGIARDGERTTIYIELSEGLKELSVNLSFDVLKKIVSKRGSADLSVKMEEITKNIRTLAKSSYTPTP